MRTVSDELKALCDELARIRNSSVVAIVLPEKPLHLEHVLKMRELVKDERCEALSVVLHSGGGDINASYQIIELLRDHCKEMTTIVPLFAKSAATLFLLASDRIVMDEIAQSGPLDTQITEPEKGSYKRVSALSTFRTLQELQEFSLRTLDLTVKLLLTRATFTIEEATRHSMDFAVRMTAPLLSQLNTDKVGEYSRALSVAKDYSVRLLRRYRKLDARRGLALVEKLIRGYPSHDYIIDYKELRELGFPVDLPGPEERAILEKIVELIFTSSDTELLVAHFRHRQKLNVKKVKGTKAKNA